MIALSNFEIIRPPYETAQEETLEWLAVAHAKAGANIRDKLWHVGCKPPAIMKRGHILRLQESPNDCDLGKRMDFYQAHADQIFEQFYPSSASPPDNLIHVTCTGYIAPSAAQKIISLRNWGEQTTVTHAYHMGCYGSIPALRMAQGFPGCTDIVHTEMCSLHANPFLHGLGQLVSQTLFSDGFIKYSAATPESTKTHYVRLLGILEEIIPGSIDSMTWNVGGGGFEISLAKEIPVQIDRALDSYLAHLCKKANLTLKEIMPEALFAIHPGGPRILQQIQRRLQLRDDQIAHSVELLRNYGNMSSATLPHLWKAMLEDATVKEGTRIVSLAFGPGLTICGTVMEKCGGSL